MLSCTVFVLITKRKLSSSVYLLTHSYQKEVKYVDFPADQYKSSFTTTNKVGYLFHPFGLLHQKKDPFQTSLEIVRHGKKNNGMNQVESLNQWDTERTGLLKKNGRPRCVFAHSPQAAEKISMAPAQAYWEDKHGPCASVHSRLAWPLRKQKQNGRRSCVFRTLTTSCSSAIVLHL